MKLEEPRETRKPSECLCAASGVLSVVCALFFSVPSSEVTYGMVAADLLHSLLAVSAEPCVLKIQSLFELDENSYPLQQNLSLLDFCPDSCKMWRPGLDLRPEEDTGVVPKE